MNKLILASSSPARRMLLERLTVPFIVVRPDIDETPLPKEAPQQLVARLTQEKGAVIAKQYNNHVVISADQVIIVRDQAISKPETRKQAVEQLLNESGQWVESLSGLGVLNSATGYYQYTCVKTRVLFRQLSLKQIHAYLAKDEAAYHCAGSLRVEALGISLLEKIESDDPTALIGLPLIALTKILEQPEFGIALL